MLEVFKQLGLTDDQVIERLINSIADRFLKIRVVESSGHDEYDEDADECVNSDHEGVTAFNIHVAEPGEQGSIAILKAVESRFKKEFDAAYAKMSNERVLPAIETYIHDKVFVETSSWGEPRGPQMTALEYIEKCANSYLAECVDKDGQTEAEHKRENSYSNKWNSAGSRLDVIVASTVKDRIQHEIKDALAIVQKTVLAAYVERIDTAVKVAVGSVNVAVSK